MVPWSRSKWLSSNINFRICQKNIDRFFKTMLVLGKQKTYYYEYDLQRVKAKAPIKIHIHKLLELFSLPIIGIENYYQYCIDNKVDLDCYKLYKTQKFGCLDANVSRKCNLIMIERSS